MKVLVFGTYRKDFTRTKNIIEGLKYHGVIVYECHEPLWKGTEDRVQAVSGGWKNFSFLVRVIRVYWNLLRKYLKSPDYDLMIVGYPGQLDIFFARILTWLRHRPLVWDILMSIYLVTVERNLDKRSPVTSSLLHFFEKTGLHLPDLLIIEGEEYAHWLCKEYDLSIERFKFVPLGTNHNEFPLLGVPSSINEDFRVVYFGSFLRNHGVDVMIEAARLLRDENIRFEFIGEGPEREAMIHRTQTLGLERVSFPGYLTREEFFEHLQRADLCLGAFGNTTHSQITVQNKIYEALVMGKPLLTGDSSALRRVFEPGKHLFVCERTPEAIAQSILYLRTNPEVRSHIAREGREFVLRQYSIEGLGKIFLQQIENLFVTS